MSEGFKVGEVCKYVSGRGGGRRVLGLVRITAVWRNGVMRAKFIDDGPDVDGTFAADGSARPWFLGCPTLRRFENGETPESFLAAQKAEQDAEAAAKQAEADEKRRKAMEWWKREGDKLWEQRRIIQMSGQPCCLRVGSRTYLIRVIRQDRKFKVVAGGLYYADNLDDCHGFLTETYGWADSLQEALYGLLG